MFVWSEQEGNEFSQWWLTCIWLVHVQHQRSLQSWLGQATFRLSESGCFWTTLWEIVVSFLRSWWHPALFRILRPSKVCFSTQPFVVYFFNSVPSHFTINCHSGWLLWICSHPDLNISTSRYSQQRANEWMGGGSTQQAPWYWGVRTQGKFLFTRTWRLQSSALDLYSWSNIPSASPTTGFKSSPTRYWGVWHWTWHSVFSYRNQSSKHWACHCNISWHFNSSRNCWPFWGSFDKQATATESVFH